MNIFGETSDAYPRIVVKLDDRTRVIAADIQWIIQRRRGDRWLSELFFRTKEGLLFYAPKPPPAELLALPDRFPEGQQRRAEAYYRRLPARNDVRRPPRPSIASVTQLSSAA